MERKKKNEERAGEDVMEGAKKRRSGGPKNIHKIN